MGGDASFLGGVLRWSYIDGRRAAATVGADRPLFPVRLEAPFYVLPHLLSWPEHPEVALAEHVRLKWPWAPTGFLLPGEGFYGRFQGHPRR